jgi:hypothetical protein
MQTRYPTPVKSVRRYCVTRCEEGPKRVRLCEDTECPLHPYRLGKQPNREGIGPKKRSPFSKNPHSTRAVCAENEKLGAKDALVHLSSPGAYSNEIENKQIYLETKGQISIKRSSNKELIIIVKSEG